MKIISALSSILILSSGIAIPKVKHISSGIVPTEGHVDHREAIKGFQESISRRYVFLSLAACRLCRYALDDVDPAHAKSSGRY